MFVVLALQHLAAHIAQQADAAADVDDPQGKRHSEAWSQRISDDAVSLGIASISPGFAIGTRPPIVCRSVSPGDPWHEHLIAPRAAVAGASKMNPKDCV
jgi:hypothetical protein